LPTAGGVASGNRFWQVLLILLALETGLFLILVPWSPVWDENFFINYFGSLHSVLHNHYVRGGVSGLGLVNLWVGFTEALTLSRRGSSPSTTRD